MKRIIFVDEAQNLESFKRAFLNSKYEIVCCESGNAALAVLRRQPFDMIVSDTHLPDMDGTELQDAVKQLYPKMTCVFLSDDQDENEIASECQKSPAKTNPWDKGELPGAAEENLAEGDPPLPEEMITYINKLEKLPTIGARYRLILNAVAENKDFSFIAAEIEKDQTVTAKILQLVNSAFYGIKTGSVQNAISYIGTNELQNLVHSMEIMDFLPASANRCFTTEKIWSHAYDTNRIQHYIQTNFLHQKVSHEVATAGLLHKIGIVLMIKFYGQEYINLIRAVFSSPDLDLAALEKSKYGFTHPQISAYFLRWWSAPEPIIEAAANYYDPTNDAVKSKEIVSIVHIAQVYAARAQGLNGFAPLIPEAFDIIHLDQSVFESEFDNLIEKQRN